MKLLIKEGRSYLFTQVHVSVIFLLIQTAFKSLENIQSSLNFEEGLGTISISLAYGCLFLSSVFIGAPLVFLIKPKWSVFLGLFSNSAFTVANIWPLWTTMIPASIVLGLLAGPFWIGQGTYMTVLATRYAEATGEDLSRVMTLFSSIFHVCFGISGPLGNFISSFVLNTQHASQGSCLEDQTKTSISINSTTFNMMNFSEIGNCSEDEIVALDFGVCGPNHCPYMETHISILQKPSQSLIYILMGTLLCFDLVAIIMGAFLKSIPTTKQTGVKQRIISTLLLVKDPNLLLLIFPIFLIGIIPGTFYATFAQVSSHII